MKKALYVLIALLFFPAFSASAAMLEGTVQKIDKSKQQIVLNTADGKETVEINSATKGAESVKAGDKVKVTYAQKGEKRVASTIAENKSGSATSPYAQPEGLPKTGSKSPMGVH
jgi:hypothetical protein